MEYFISNTHTHSNTGTMFTFVALIAVANGLFIYLYSWGNPHFTASQAYGFNVTPVSHLERSVAVFLIAFAILNGWAAVYGTKSFRMLTSFLNMIVVTHFFIEVWVGAYTGLAFLSTVIFLYLNTFYSIAEFSGGAKRSRSRRRTFVSELAGRRTDSISS